MLTSNQMHGVLVSSAAAAATVAASAAAACDPAAAAWPGEAQPAAAALLGDCTCGVARAPPVFADAAGGAASPAAATLPGIPGVLCSICGAVSSPGGVIVSSPSLSLSRSTTEGWLLGA